MHWRSI